MRDGKPPAPVPWTVILLMPVPVARSLTLAGRWAPAGKTRSMAAPLGATPPCQFPGVLQLAFAPAPVQVNVAGASRSSNCSKRSPATGSSGAGFREKQRVHRRDRAFFDISWAPSKSTRRYVAGANEGTRLRIAAQG